MNDLEAPLMNSLLLLPLHSFNSLFSSTTWVSQYQKGKTSLDLNEARDGGVLECNGISWTICKQSAPLTNDHAQIKTSMWLDTGVMLSDFQHNSG